MSYKTCKQIKDMNREHSESFFENGLVYVFPEINNKEYCCFWKEDGCNYAIETFDEKAKNMIPLENLHMLNIVNYLKEHPKHILFLSKDLDSGKILVTDVFKREYNWAQGEHIECVHYERYSRYLKEYDIPYLTHVGVIENTIPKDTPPDYVPSTPQIFKRYDFKAKNGGIIWYRVN